MMIRCTARLLKIVGKPDAAAVKIPPSDDDWHANIMWIEGHKCLHATHAAFLFAIFVPNVRTNDIRPLRPFLAAKIAEQLAAEGLPGDVLGVLDGARATIGETESRQILGCMIDQAFAGGSSSRTGVLLARTSGGIHRHLQNNIVSARKCQSPLDLIANRLAGA